MFRDNRKQNTKKGFTLIELLVVISIIGVLSSIVLSSLNTARAKARNAVRLSDMAQMERALNLYFDKYGQYPSTCSGGTPNCTYSANNPRTYYSEGCSSPTSPYIPDLSEFYPILPVDPRPLGNTSCYAYRSNGTHYSFWALNTFEVENVSPDNMYGKYYWWVSDYVSPLSTLQLTNTDALPLTGPSCHSFTSSANGAFPKCWPNN